MIVDDDDGIVVDDDARGKRGGLDTRSLNRPGATRQSRFSWGSSISS